MKHRALIAAVVVGLVSVPTAAMADQRPGSSRFSHYGFSNSFKHFAYGRGDSWSKHDRYDRPGRGHDQGYGHGNGNGHGNGHDNGHGNGNGHDNDHGHGGWHPDDGKSNGC